jgi:hypothetical protein
MTLAFSSKHPFVPNPSKDPNASRWIASLSDGTTVFEDVTPGDKSAWLRLRDYIAAHNLKLTNLRLEAYGHRVVLIPYKDEFGNPQINGYWHSKKALAILNASEIGQVHWSGIGFVKGREIHVTWVDHNGNVSYELKKYDEANLACIVNDAV